MELDPTHLAALAGWIYVIVFAVAFLDAVLPIVPSESVVVTGAVMAVHGDASLTLVLVAAAAGAVSGDALSYGLGARVRRRRVAAGTQTELGGRTGKAVQWAEGMLRTRAFGTLIVARFLPGGRTATTFTAGFTGMDGRAFGTGIAAGGVLWAAQSALVGYAGGHVFGDNVALGVLIGVASGALVGVTVEWVRARRSAALPTPLTESPLTGTTVAPERSGAEVITFPTRPQPTPAAA